MIHDDLMEISKQIHELIEYSYNLEHYLQALAFSLATKKGIKIYRKQIEEALTMERPKLMNLK